MHFFLGALRVNSLPASNKVCRLLLTFAKQFGSKLFDTLIVFLKDFYEKVHFEKSQQMTKNHEKLPKMQRVSCLIIASDKRAIHIGSFFFNKIYGPITVAC